MLSQTSILTRVRSKCILISAEPHDDERVTAFCLTNRKMILISVSHELINAFLSPSKYQWVLIRQLHILKLFN